MGEKRKPGKHKVAGRRVQKGVWGRGQRS